MHAALFSPLLSAKPEATPLLPSRPRTETVCPLTRQVIRIDSMFLMGLGRGRARSGGRLLARSCRGGDLVGCGNTRLASGTETCTINPMTD